MKTMAMKGVLAGVVAAWCASTAVADFLPWWWEKDDATRRRWVLTGGDNRVAIQDLDAPYDHGFPGTWDIKYWEAAGEWEYKLEVENQFQEDWAKLIWLEYTWKEEEGGIMKGPEWTGYFGSPQGEWSMIGYPAWPKKEDLGDGLWRLTVKYKILPQPESEWFQWWTNDNAYLTEVRFGSYCMLPAPGTLAMLAVAGVATGRRRRV